MERDLLVRLRTAREAVAGAEDALKSAREVERKSEAELIEYLEGKGARATGKYDGIGWAQINAPRLFASMTMEAQPAVFAWLRTHGQESAIKETVHSSTLSQIVGEQLREDGEVPAGIQYYLKPQVRLY